jgi:hypothetical protein
MTWMFSRRRCVFETEYWGLRVRVCRIVHPAPFWLSKGLDAEYELDFARRVKWQWKTFATLRQLDMPKIVELHRKVEKYLHGAGNPEALPY